MDFSVIFGERWRDISLYSLISGTLLAAAFPSALAPFQFLVGSLDVSQRSVIGIFAILALSWPDEAKRKRWWGFKHFWNYPPLTISIMGGIGIFLCMSWAFDVVSFIDGMTLAGRLLLVSFVSAIILLFCYYISEPCPLPDAQTKGHSKNIIDWLRSDVEIASPEDDRFGHNKIAKRIAERLTHEGGAPTIALKGEKGSGKSSVRALVAYHLRDNKEVEIVDHSLWAYESTGAAVRGIINSIISRLSLHVGTLPLEGLSESYVSIVEKNTGGVGALATLLRNTDSPEHTLRDIDRIASVIGIRIILWVEDLERFSSEGQDPGNRLGPIRALLHLLDRMDHVAVVMADASLSSRFDLNKLARFIEVMPKPSAEQINEVIQEIRPYPPQNGIIDPASDFARRLLNYSDNLGTGKFMNQRREGRPSIYYAIRELIDTPRKLKQPMRQAFELWKRFPGEFDFDSVLVASILREIDPALIDKIDDNHIFFTDRHTDGERDSTVVYKEFFDYLKERYKDDKIVEAIDRLLRFLSPHFGSEDEQPEPEPEWFERPQSLFSDDDRYWRSYLSQSFDDYTVSDQGVLRSMNVWRNRKSSDIVNRNIVDSGIVDSDIVDSDIVDSDIVNAFTNPVQLGFVRKTKCFASMLSVSDIFALLTAVVKKLCKIKPEEFLLGPPYSRFGYLCSILEYRVSHLHTDPGKEIRGKLEPLIRATTPHNIALAHELTFVFAGSEKLKKYLVDDDPQKQLKEVLRDAVLNHFINEDDTDTFDQRLLGILPGPLSQIIFYEEIEIKGNKDAKQFGKLLLKYADEQPELALKYVLALIPNLNPQPNGSLEAIFYPKNAEILFDRKDLADRVPDWERRHSLTEEQQSQLKAAIVWATRDAS